jgi:hypothetical protein
MEFSPYQPAAIKSLLNFTYRRMTPLGHVCYLQQVDKRLFMLNAFGSCC